MSKNYLCPDCKGQLRVIENIIFSVKRPNGETGLLMLSPEIGDYTVYSHPDFKLSEGEKLEIFCPICHFDLKDQKMNTNLASVLVVNEDKTESRILFSEIVGQKCTYKVSVDHVEAYGDDLDAYTNFFGEMPKY